MENIYIIIDKYIYNVTEFNKYCSLKNINLIDYHLKDGTFDIIMKYENDDTINLFKNVNKYNSYFGIELISLNIFKKNIPRYFFYAKNNKIKNNKLKNMKNKDYILLYCCNFYNLIIKDNDKINEYNLINISNEWCYYFKFGVYNTKNIEDLIDIILNKYL